MNPDSKYFSKNIRASESGALIVFLAVSLVALVAMAALAVDQGKGFMNHREAENLADQIAIAAVKGLDGTKPGWRNSIALAEDIIAKSEIHTIDMDAVEAAASANISNIDTPDLNIQIQWGFFGHTAGYDQEGVFTPFSNINQIDEDTFRLPAYFLANAVKVQVTVKNVDLPFQSALNSILGVAGIDIFEKIVGIATALRDEEIEQPVVPIAIPACHFFTDFNPTEDFRYDINIFDESNATSGNFANYYASQLARMSAREIIAREAVGLDRGYDIGSDTFKARVDGNLRSDGYPLPPLYNFPGTGNNCFESRSDGTNIEGWQPNCKAPSINAVLGIPGTSGNNAPSSGSAVAAAFGAQANNPIRRGRIGAGFRPIRASDDTGSEFLNSAMSQAVEDAISDSSVTFEDVFVDGNPGNTLDTNPGQSTLSNVGNANFNSVDSLNYRANFPKRRNIRSGSGAYRDPLGELRVVFMGDSPDPRDVTVREVPDPNAPSQTILEVTRAPVQMGLAMGNTSDYIHVSGGSITQRHQHPRPGGGPRRFTNPMCHTPVGGTIDADNYNSKVLVGQAMLVAARDWDYCDFGARMTDNYSSSAAFPDAQTSPVVVGFVPINIFDFRLTELEDQGGPIVRYPGPWDDSVHQPVLWNQNTSDIGNSKDINDWALDLAYSMPEFLDLLNQASNFSNQLDSEDWCRSCDPSTASGPIPENCTSNTTTVSCPVQQDQNLDDLLENLEGFTEPSCLPNTSPDEEVACVEPYTIPEWVDVCFGDIGNALEEIAEEAAFENAWSCYEVCGGIHVPVGWTSDPNFEPTRQNLGPLLNDPILSNTAPGATSEDGREYQWIGFDSACVTALTNGASSLGDDVTSIDCVTSADGISRQPRGTWDCSNICSGAKRKTSSRPCGGIFGSCRKSVESACITACEGAQGVNNLANQQNQENFADNTVADSEAYDLTPPPPPEENGPASPVLAVAESLENDSGATQVCMPRLQNDAENYLSNEAWEPPWPRVAGYGCGGIRLRLTHEPVSLIFGKTFDQLRPAIVGK